MDFYWSPLYLNTSGSLSFEKLSQKKEEITIKTLYTTLINQKPSTTRMSSRLNNTKYSSESSMSLGSPVCNPVPLPAKILSHVLLPPYVNQRIARRI